MLTALDSGRGAGRISVAARLTSWDLRPAAIATVVSSATFKAAGSTVVVGLHKGTSGHVMEAVIRPSGKHLTWHGTHRASLPGPLLVDFVSPRRLVIRTRKLSLVVSQVREWQWVHVWVRAHASWIVQDWLCEDV